MRTNMREYRAVETEEMLRTDLREYIQENYEEMLQLLRELCRIPAPSHQEQARAVFCRNWLAENGAEGVYIDDARNVIYPLGCDDCSEITVFAAHLDTVFPDTEPLPFREDAEKIYCPGVGDDTASVAVLLMAARYCTKRWGDQLKGVLFVCNSCEEGLGNLKGTRQLMQDYRGRIRQFVTLDSKLNVMNTKCVGSHRYQVEVRTEGGHSFQMFGKPNAIAVLSRIVSRIYEMQVPQLGDSRTSYNVGVISGGTSVNTIAQSAGMLCEYRSDSIECLGIMERKFGDIFAAERAEGVEICVERIGERPCGAEVNAQQEEKLVMVCRGIIEDVIQESVICKSASTDCNIPLSLGIPAVCIGVYRGGGSHTREEWIEKASLKQGLEIAVRVITSLLFSV